MERYGPPALHLPDVVLSCLFVKVNASINQVNSYHDTFLKVLQGDMLNDFSPFVDFPMCSAPRFTGKTMCWVRAMQNVHSSTCLLFMYNNDDRTRCHQSELTGKIIKPLISHSRQSPTLASQLIGFCKAGFLNQDMRHNLP